MRSSLLAIALLVAPIAWPQPVVNAVVNFYSYTPPGLPNYGIAQGSMFAIFGTGLTSTPSPLQALPLKTSVNGVSVQITVAGVTTQALLYYVLPNQIGGVLPSATPAGSGQIIVTVNGQASPPAPITVVQSAFGIDASQGAYPVNAAVFEPERGFWIPMSATNAANPGDTIEIYGTGAGPTTGSEAGAQLPPQNLSNLPIEVDIGGVSALVTFHGRSSWPGLDQLNVVIPPGLSGCRVSLVVVTSGFVSNFASLPIAQEGRACTDQVPGVTPPAAVQVGPQSVDNIGFIQLNRAVDVTQPVTDQGGTKQPAQNSTVDLANAMFQRFTYTQPTRITIGSSGVATSLRNCTVTSVQFPPPDSVGTSGAPLPFTNLNAGSAINFTGPNGLDSIPASGPGYNGILAGDGTNLPSFLPPAGGAVSVDNGSGGPDVGSFSTQINASPVLVWTNMTTIPATIDRSQGVTVTWTGGNPAGIVSIGAASSVANAAGTALAQVSCVAPVSDGRFTVPASALPALHPNPVASIGPNPSLQLQTTDQFVFSAPGLDAGVIDVSVQNRLTVGYR